MSIARKNDWVEVENIVLNPEERSDQLPEDTKEVPLMMWIRGFLVENEAKIGDEVSIITLSGRKTQGKLVNLNPKHEHDFGESLEILLSLGKEIRDELEDIKY